MLWRRVASEAITRIHRPARRGIRRGSPDPAVRPASPEDAAELPACRHLTDARSPLAVSESGCRSAHPNYNGAPYDTVIRRRAEDICQYQGPRWL
ncbi:hypotheticcal protein [Gordonia sp. KTR9]|nr:hypotheticcal protein [Gordonia sp. KTR9]